MHYETIKDLLPKGAGTRSNAQLVEKAMRDARLLREHARLVIILDYTEQGEVFCREVIDNSKGYIADVIAVLAPVHLFEGAFILDQGLALEIGMSRGRPYRQAETKKHPKQPGIKMHIKGRRRLREATLQEIRAAWLHIETHLQMRTEKRQRERTQNMYVLHGGTYIHEDGVYVTVSKSDAIFYYKIVVEDARARQERYINARASWIVAKLRPYRSSKVTGKRFKYLKGVVRVADAIKNMRRFTYAPIHLMRALIRTIPKDVKTLFEDVLESHGLAKLANTASRTPRLPPGLLLARELPELSSARFWIVRKQGTQPQRRGRNRCRPGILSTKQAPHAQGCVVAEHYLPAPSY